MDFSQPRNITHAILCLYYPVVSTLRDYVTALTGRNDTQRDPLIHETDTLRYRHFLEEIVVATQQTTSEPRILQISPPVGYLREVGASCQDGAFIEY